MSTIDGLVKKLDQAGSDLVAGTRTGVNAAARVMAAAVDASIAGDTRGGVLRGMGGKPIHARVNPAGSVERPVALVNTNNPGAMKILESGAKRHVVGSGQKGAQGVSHNQHGVLHTVTKSGGKSYAAKLMRIGDTGDVVWGPFESGGSPAKHTFTNAANATAPKVAETVRRETNRVLTRIFH